MPATRSNKTEDKLKLYPCSLPDFLTKKERLDVKDRIFSLKNYWLTLEGKSGLVNDVTKRSFTLGHACYVLMTPSNSLMSTIDNTYMLDYFGDVYDKTVFFLKKKLNLDNIQLFNEFTLPGFHIFRGPRKSAFSELNFHVDGSIFNFYEKSENFKETTYSFSSLIHSSPKAHLEYKRDNDTRSFEYKEGDLNVWSSYLPHKIGTCDIEDGEFRITYQGHVFKYKGKNYMYF